MKDIKITKSEKKSWEYIKDYYCLDFLLPGQHVVVSGKHGTVIGACNQYLIIHIPGEGSGNYHPTSNIVYLGNKGEMIKDFREK